MPQTKESFLKSRTTQFLLKSRYQRYRPPNNEFDEFNKNQILLADSLNHFFYSEEEFLQELNKRPHISHKRERKSIKSPKNYE